MAPLLHYLPLPSSPLGVAGVIAASLAAIYLLERFVISVPYPKGIALVGEPEGARRFSLRTRLRYYVACEDMFREAYHDYLKKGLPVVIPGLGFRKEVIMPPSSMRHVLSQPESVLSVGEAFADIDKVRWSMGYDSVIVDAWQGHLVKTEMNRVLENTCAALNDELGVAFEEWFGVDTEAWRELNVLDVMSMVVAQGAARFTVGLPLCRNKEYLDATIATNNLLIANAGLTGLLPTLLQPLLGPIFNIPISFKLRTLRRHLVPLWKSRLLTLQHDRDDPNHVEPADHTQMMVRYAAKERPEELHDLDLITARLIVQNFGTTHNTAMQATNLLLNVIASDEEFGTIGILREEANRVLNETSSDDEKDSTNTKTTPKWTKSRVNNLPKADSASRETLRLHAFGGRAIMRMVKTADFYTDTGVHLPKGTTISFLSQPAHVDEATHDDPSSYDPFRFSRMREAAAAAAANEKATTATNGNTNGDVNANIPTKAPAVSFVTTSPDFLPFGHGKHACPGRFLIDFEFKMILAYILLHYDVKFPDEYNGKRPANVWLAEAMVPPSQARILVRRRK